MEPELNKYAIALAERARTASYTLRTVPTQAKNAWLEALQQDLIHHTSAILTANQCDLDAAVGLSSALRDRLLMNEARLGALAKSLEQVRALPDPVGEVREESVRPNGLLVRKVGVPLGVVLFLYESRPNVTVDAAALCVKSGNCVILRGGKEALHTNRALAQVIQSRLAEFGLPGEAVQFVETTERGVVGEFLQCRQQIDLVIPRGGPSLVERVVAEATMPVLKHYQGNCHVYVDRAADMQQAAAIVENAKCQRPGVCNAMETLLVHEEIADAFLPGMARRLIERGVELRGCPLTLELVPVARPATDEDYATEYLDLILSVKVVSGLDDAVEHIRCFGSGHTEVIVSQDEHATAAFCQSVDASAVIVNASTRFNDGFELGLGAEIGISTDKFHARGPCGLRELTTYQYIVLGHGQVRA